MGNRRGLRRREFLKASGAAAGAAFMSSMGHADARTEAQPLPRTLEITAPAAPPRRLCDATRELARQGLGGEWGKALVNSDVRLEDVMDVSGLSEEMRYAHSIRLIAEKAPVRILPDERIVGSATLREAASHQVPIYGKSSVSHTTLGFDRVLKIGYRGLRREVDERLERGGLDEQGRDLLKAMKVCLDGAARWHARYMAALGGLIESSSGEQRAHYEHVRSNLAGVPENPPATFEQAVQSLWFMYAFQRLCGTWSGIGRIDEMLGPYLARDLAAGRITLDEAREALAHFWIKGTEWIGANPWPGSGDAQFYQNIVLGGVDARGKEVTNDVTYLVLDVVEELHISDFPIAVRLNRKSPERLLRRMAEVQRHGGGIVAAYNEEVVIEALVRFGYELAEARCFANDGCWEALIPGKTCFTYSPFDTLHLLQNALGVHLAEPQGVDYPDFESLYAAFSDQLRAHIEGHRDGLQHFCRGGLPATVVSMMVDGCIEKGRGYFERGPKYTVLATHAGGIANTADSLLAIKKLVYDQKLLTLKEFVDILRADWQGEEPMRRMVLSRIPAYGNDDDEADAMAVRVFDTFTDIAGEERERHGVLSPAGISTFGREIEWRAHRMASADGHHQGEILATNLSPSPGSDTLGPTAALKSYCKMDFTKLPNIGTLELKILPSSVRGERGIDALAGLLRSFVRLGGCFVHVDVMDSALLLAAQRYPERYPNLSVRIAGWSARFATLNKDWQDMVIARTQQVLRA